MVGDALAVAEDYGDLAEGLLVLYQATGEQRWLDAARELLDAALELFVDDDGSVFDTGSDAERLVRRPRDPSDNAAPSGTSALAAALLAYSALTGSMDHRAAAERALRIVTGAGTAQPRFFGWALAAAEALIDGPVQIALVGADAELVRVAWSAQAAGCRGRVRRARPARRRRCSPTVRWSAGSPPPTCAAAWSAICRSPAPTRWPRGCGADQPRLPATTLTSVSPLHCGISRIAQRPR